ncbi:MAG: CoA transferase [Hyphomicrobiales bacterium]|nr:CoA transferase [Hyphomicrobiales bacterium]MCP4999583.1 CoA transferase [Hyphomicrobiales bacterium]
MDKPLHGLKIVEMAGLGPAPFGCYLLVGLGAEVTRIEAKGRAAVFLPLDPHTNPDVLYRNVQTLDLKSDGDRQEALTLICAADVLVEGFRPGVMERLGLGPDDMLQANPGLVYARMTGYGQNGPMSDRAGHDLNYISMSGVLSMIGRKDSPPVPPLNLIGDYGGGTMVLIMGILSALYARQQTGKGRVIDASMVEGSAMLATPIFSFMASGMWQGGERGQNLLDSGCPFYDTYETSDGLHVAVAPLEPQFFAALLKGLSLDDGWAQKQYDRESWEELRALLKSTFLTKTRDEWAELFATTDACVTPVLTPKEAAIHKHNAARQSFDTVAGHIMPGLAPKFS